MAIKMGVGLGIVMTHQASHVAAGVVVAAAAAAADVVVVVSVAGTVSTFIGRRWNDLTRSGNLLPIFEIIINYRLAGGVVDHPVFGDRALALQDESVPSSLLCHGLFARNGSGKEW